MKENKPLILRYDEFFKVSCLDFFTRYGFQVKTELEIFKLPKRLDVLAIHSRKKVPDEFTLLKYWNRHNLISYKSKNDKLRRKDILDAILYLNGYINNTSSASFENVTMSVFMNHSIPKYFQNFKIHIHLTEPGVCRMDFNLFHIFLIDLREINLSGLDRKFLAHFSTDEKFYELIGLTEHERKEIDELKPYMKVRVSDSTINPEVKEKIMRNEAVLDIEWARPAYEKGKIEGKLEGKKEGEIQKALEIARLLKVKDFPVHEIMDITGLSEEELRGI